MTPRALFALLQNPPKVAGEWTDRVRRSPDGRTVVHVFQSATINPGEWFASVPTGKEIRLGPVYEHVHARDEADAMRLADERLRELGWLLVDPEDTP